MAVRDWQHHLREQARTTLSGPLWEYVEHGAGAEVTLGEAGSAWSATRLWPKVLRDVTEVDLTTSVLGADAAVPWGVAPTSLQVAVHPEGDLAMARAAQRAGAVLTVSSNTGTRFEEIGEVGARWWLQVYLPADRTLAVPMLERAVAAGAEAVVLTVDTPVVGTWHPTGEQIWDVVAPGSARVNFDGALDGAHGAEKATDLGPHDLDWLRETTGLPVVAKGVLRPDDAVRCVQAGARAVWVSTHGGRQLDRSVSTATALPVVRAAVGDTCEVYVDGGLRGGLDVVTALASGADLAFLGRLPLYALAGGAASLDALHGHLRDEVVETLRLGGCRRPSEAGELLAPTPQTVPAADDAAPSDPL